MTSPDPKVPETDPAPPPDPSDPLAMAKYLGASMNRLTGQLKDAKEASEERDKKIDRDSRKRDRHNRWILAVDIALTIAVAVLGYGYNHANDSASSAQRQATAANVRAAAATAAELAEHDALISGCETSNVHNAAELKFWKYLFNASKTPTTKALATFESLVDAAFAPKDCAVVYALKPQPKETDSGK